MKTWILLSLVFFIACAKSPDGGKFVSQKNAPLTFYVPSSRYYEFKEEFDKAEALIRSKTGKQLVKYLPSDSNPQFSTGNSALFSSGSTHWILFKEDYDHFTEMDSGIAGTTYFKYGLNKELYKSIIVINFTLTQWYWDDGHNFEQVILHETLHCLGFDHTLGTDYSIMNYNYNYQVDGLTGLDVSRLSAKYPFSMEVVTVKDLEKLAANKERNRTEVMSHNLSETFGLSSERSIEVAKLMVSYQAIQNKRALSESEMNMVSNQLLGFSYSQGKDALAKYLQGEETEMDNLLEIAAKKNGTSPEQVKDILQDFFVQSQ